MYSYSRQHLDSPPPSSQVRRPWSPDPYEPLPPMRSYRNEQAQFDSYAPEETDYEFYSRPPQQTQQRREPSDVSVDALDLADYARTLRPYPTRQQRHEVDALDSIRTPSLVSRGNTLTSSANSNSSRPSRRPFSLPPHSSHSSRGGPAATHRTHNYPYLVNEEPEILSSPANNSEIDISQFPAWSRGWYNSRVGGGAFSSPTSPPDIYTPLPTSYFDLKRSPFDPNHTLKHASNSFQGFDADPFSTAYSSHLSPSMGHDSTRDLLPWSADPPEYGPTIDSSLKEERIRMLEREFGPNAKATKGKDDQFVDENGKPLVGTVDSKGNLVTQGPKKRIATRVLQILCALAASIPSIYAALMIKPNPAAPPAGKPAAYVLYLVSVVTLLALLFLFLFYPCCRRRRKTSGIASGGNPFANGMMVLPVQGLPGGKQNKKNKGRKGKKGQGGGMGGGDVQVNLIVDPNVFGNNHEEEEDEEEDERDWERSSSVPGGWNGSSAGGPKKKRKRANKRRSVFAGLAMEEEWKRARRWTKKIMAFDVVFIVLWGGVFVFILIGKRCPIGGYEGWCNAYNVSSAAACFLCVTFCISTFFDIKDLSTSKVSPRTRT